MDLEFRYLRDFLAIVESGSLGDAARRLKTSQPTLTRSVKLLERAVGGPVFDRTPHGMRPTALGRALVDHARTILGDVDRAQRTLDDLIEGRRGKIVVGTGALFGASILPRAVARFQASRPGLDVRVVQGPLRDIMAAVKAGEIDCSFHSAPAYIDPDLMHRPLLRAQATVMVGRRDNPLVARHRLTLKDVAREPWIMPALPDYFRQKTEAVFQRAGIEPPKPVIEFTAVTGAARFLLERRDLVGLFFHAFIASELESKRLAAFSVKGLAVKADSSVIFRRGTPLPAATALFLNEVRAVCAEQPRL